LDGYLVPGQLNRPSGAASMHDPERAPLVRRAFEEYATGRYTKEQLVDTLRRAA
jgi:hypothetical protein